MSTIASWARIKNKPKSYLALYWTLWKLILAVVALLSPGIGYDTSTDVLFSTLNSRGSPSSEANVLRYGLQKWIRWDAIYFSQIARRGHFFEQEWAFGWGFTRLLHFGAKVFPFIDHGTSGLGEAFIGILLAHVSHLLSVFILYDMSRSISSRKSEDEKAKFAFLAGLLHTISPAGIFLSAPCAESPFALLTFLGYFYYLKRSEYQDKGDINKRDLSSLAAGLLFGIAVTFRGNGLLSGCIFAYDAVAIAWKLLSRQDYLNHARDFFVIVVSGSLVALGYLIPQLLAFREYCWIEVEEMRPWCSRWFPSIYTWVQSHYWGVGFMKYWTISNFPLFLLAGPMLSILILSAILNVGQSINSTKTRLNGADTARKIHQPRGQLAERVWFPDVVRDDAVRRLVVPQFILALLALTTYHVQIITRLSSGYPVWYWWLASMILEDHKVKVLGKYWSPAKIIVQWMICYTIIQGGLFASFLPPA